MGHNEAYLICKNKCYVKGYSAKQIDELLKKVKGFINVKDGEVWNIWVGTKSEYNAINTIDPHTYYVITDDSTVDKANYATAAGTASIATTAKDVDGSIKNLPITDIFEYFDEETGELTSGAVKRAVNSTYATYTDFSNTDLNETEFDSNGEITANILEPGKFYYLGLKRNDTGNQTYSFGIVYIPTQGSGYTDCRGNYLIIDVDDTKITGYMGSGIKVTDAYSLLYKRIR